MDELSDYPLASFLSGLNTALGRVVLVVLAALAGAFLGGASAGHSLESAWGGVTTLPILAVGSIFFAVGIVVLPAVIIFAIAFARSEWPLWIVLVATGLMWWNTHKMICWTLYDSPTAKLEKRLNAQLNAEHR